LSETAALAVQTKCALIISNQLDNFQSGLYIFVLPSLHMRWWTQGSGLLLPSVSELFGC